MKHYLYRMWTDQRGVILVVTLMLMGLMAALASVYTLTIRADTALRGGAGRERSGFYAAEAGLNYAMNKVRASFDDFNPPNHDEDTISVGTGAQQRNVTYIVAEVPGENPGPPEEIPAGKQFAGMTSIPSKFTVNSTAENILGDTEAKLGAEFTIYSVPIFQFLAYYANTLEILPGPNMTVSGRIHTNSDLYLNTNGGSTFSVGDRLAAPVNRFVQVSAAGNIFRGRLDANGCSGTVVIDMLQDTTAPLGDLDPRTLACEGGGTSQVSEANIAAYQGSLLAGIDPLEVPDVSTLERNGSPQGIGVFWNKADLRIVLRLDKGLVNPNFAAACPGAPYTNAPNLFPIEVVDKDGNTLASLTNSLKQFMCERRGAIFYNDVPNANAQGTWQNSYNPTNPNGNDPGHPNNYTPTFGQFNQLGAGFTAAQKLTERAARVYRRVGEDTNGNGTIDTSGSNGINAASIIDNDRNLDICPIPPFSVAPGTRPAWRPDYCNLAPMHVAAPGLNWPRPWPNAIVTAPADITQISAWYRDMDYRRGGYYNRREDRWMYLLNVNLRALIDWNEANGALFFATTDATDGGLVIFLSVQAADSQTSPPNNGTVRYGVRVFDSANLNTRNGTFAWPAPADPTGVTIASDQAIYVEGNYNFMGTAATAKKYPAAIMGDTINVLSQGWETPVSWNGSIFPNDRKSAANLGARDVPTTDNFINGAALGCPAAAPAPCNAFNTATALGINAAFLARVDDTVPGDYNGGLENYPRFHEDWGGRTLNYRGSYVSLGTPLYSNGHWEVQSYSPPQRQWDYDAQFNDPRWLPPLTPMVNMVQQRVYTRFYK
ncbi:MAG: hypothetical protein AB7G75_18725 [Candidatus Binatia bacterium]